MIGFHGIGEMLKRRRDRTLQACSLREAALNAKVEGRRQGRRERDEEYTLHVAAPDDHGIYRIGEQPRHEYVRIALTPRLPVDVDSYLRDRGRSYFHDAHIVTFRATKHGWTSGNGQHVVWWSWELAR